MSEPVIQLQDVRVRYRARSSSLFRPHYVDALAGVSLTVRRGQTLGIVGESGSGKSTSAKVLIGLEKPTSGQVVFDGETVRSFTPAVRKRLGRILSVVFQDPATALNARMTVRAASGSASRSPGPSSSTPRSSWRTSRPRPSTSPCARRS